jgi:plastocyanin
MAQDVSSTVKVLSLISLIMATAGLVSCGGSSTGSPTGGTTVISASTGSVGPSGATITITATGASPQQVSITIGQSVTFVNNDTRPHEMASDPHPIHGTCPGIEQGIGTLAAGQTKLTQGFANAGTCGFHDHLNSGTASLQGTIVIR